MPKFYDGMVWGKNLDDKLERCKYTEAKRQGCWNATCMYKYTCMTEGENFGTAYCKARRKPN